MRNVLGVILAAIGAALVALPFSPEVAAVLAGLLLTAGALLLVIDWDAR
jgi:hypothetical protein